VAFGIFFFTTVTKKVYKSQEFVLVPIPIHFLWVKNTENNILARNYAYKNTGVFLPQMNNFSMNINPLLALISKIQNVKDGEADRHCKLYIYSFKL
jgi:hypothetical protein